LGNEDNQLVINSNAVDNTRNYDCYQWIYCSLMKAVIW